MPANDRTLFPMTVPIVSSVFHLVAPLAGTVEPATAAANAEAEQEEDIEVNQEMRRLLRQPRYFDQDFEQAAVRRPP